MKSSTALASLLSIAFAASLGAQTDPGTRNGPPRSGPPLRGLAPAEMQSFLNGRDDFNEIDDVKDGLGPRFNLDSCGGRQPPPPFTRPRPHHNTQPRVF